MEKHIGIKFGIGKKQLIYFLVLSLVPLLIGGIISFTITKNQLEESTKVHLSDLARDCGRKISYYISPHYQSTKLLSQADVFKGSDTYAKQKYIEDAIEAYPFYDAITVIDLDGTITACTRKELIGDSRADRTWFQETVQCKQGCIAPLDAYRAETSGWKMVIGFNSPIRDESNREVIGVLTTRISMDHIIERVQTLYERTVSGNHAYLLNKRGEILAGPDENEFLAAHRLIEFPVVRDLLAGKTGITEYKDDRGEDVISARYALKGDGDFDGWGWGIIVTVPVSEAFKAAFIIRNTMIVLVLVIAFLVTVFAAFISKGFSRPIKEVSESALRISNGDLKPIKIKYSLKDEIGDLVVSFNKMTEDLHATTVSRDSLAKEIIERKRAEAALRESEEKFRILSEQSLLGIIIIQDGLIKYANEAFSKIVEYSIEEILDWKLDDFIKAVHPDDQSLVMEHAQNKQEGDEFVVNHYPIRMVTKSGAVKWIETYTKTIMYNNRKADMTTIIDFTEKKKSEEKSKLQQQQLIQSERLASLGVLVAGVAHEINNPNHTIMSNTNRVREAWKSIAPILRDYYEENGDFIIGGFNYTEMREEMPIYLEGISDGSKRIDSIVNNLKNYARQEDYDITKDINMNLVVNSAITLSSNYIRKAAKNFNVEFEKNIPQIKGNFQRLEQVIINLIQNSCQALSNREKALFVKTSYNKFKQRIEVNIRDEGVGISPENVSRVKDPFFTTKRNSGGTGLGLSISSTIIEDHHGTLNIKSKPGKGTTVTITLPVIEDNTITEELE